MIDIESEVFTVVSDNVREFYPDIYMTGEKVRTPPRFPCVSLIEADNAQLRRTQTNENYENHVRVMYEVNVYSDKHVGKKRECRSIMSCISDAMSRLGFTRTMMNPFPNLEDETIYRIVARFVADVGADGQIYRR